MTGWKTISGGLPLGRIAGATRRGRTVLRVAVIALLTLIAVFSLPGGMAHALDPIDVGPERERIEITKQAVYYESRGDRLQIDTAPDEDGISARIVVSAATSGTNPGWTVFALRNKSDKTIERWLVASRYTLVGSGVVWPDLDKRRLEAITPSLGIVPVRVKNDQQDIFRITLPPGRTVTFAAELASAKPTRLFLWQPLAFTQKSRDLRLFNGIMLGIVGLLGIFLTAIFAANHKAIFPSAALVSWCVLAYLCVDFGFWHKLFQLSPDDNAMYRAATESAVAASLVIFLYAFLRLGAWHGFIRMLFAVWIAAQLVLVAAAVLDPRLASTFARLSFLAIGGFGGLLALFLAVRGQHRALSLIPTWLLFGVWIFGVAMALTGRLSGDIIVSALIAGLVLIVLLVGFTVTQFAFRSVEPVYGTAPSQLQLRSLAIDGSGSGVWEWTAKRDEIRVSPIIEAVLGLSQGELCVKTDAFAEHLHPSDRERFRLQLFSAKENKSEFIHMTFRMRHADNSYRWLELEAATAPGANLRSLRCVGLIRDITEAKRSQERLMHDAVHDSLTGMPNRELFLDRLGVTMTRAQTEPHIRPGVVFIDIDKFKSVNSSFGLIVGDSLLLTVARRLIRHIGPNDTLARIGGDQFAILFPAGFAAGHSQIKALTDEIQYALRAPINIAGQEIILTVSIGVATYDTAAAAEGDIDLLHDGEVAMYHAKRAGADRSEMFVPAMREEKDKRIAIESDLRRALDNKQLKLLYQPIVQLATEELVGFEALVRWDHPKLGELSPAAFVPVAEETDLIVKLGSFVLGRAATAAARWHEELPRVDDPLFVSVNVSSRQLFRNDLIQEMRHILGRNIVPEGSLRLEVTETLMMENPERATQMLGLLKSAGAELSIDDFGTGYSSLAYLQRFPFDTIKIDRALVQGSGEDGPEGTIVRSIVALAHELDKKVIAEGVETAEDVAFLRSIQCGYAQGFYYGKPMTEAQVYHLLRTIRKTERRRMGSGLFKNKARKKPIKEAAIAPPAARLSREAISRQPARAQANGAGPIGQSVQPGQSLQPGQAGQPGQSLQPGQAGQPGQSLPPGQTGQPVNPAMSAVSAHAGPGTQPEDPAVSTPVSNGVTAEGALAKLAAAVSTESLGPGQDNWMKRREEAAEAAAQISLASVPEQVTDTPASLGSQASPTSGAIDKDTAAMQGAGSDDKTAQNGAAPGDTVGLSENSNAVTGVGAGAVSGTGADKTLEPPVKPQLAQSGQKAGSKIANTEATDFPTLPPAIAASLARLAGGSDTPDASAARGYGKPAANGNGASERPNATGENPPAARAKSPRPGDLAKPSPPPVPAKNRAAN